ncbi:hypothetical protein BJF83_17225 [Nocardiopsis sp. CNR-923]|nr:hypothetical protein BJF83_17225 [Nocardiopsis sp. CNR-923]
MLDNMSSLATHRRHFGVPRESAGDSTRLDERFADYSSHIQELDEEIKEVVRVEREAADISIDEGGVDGQWYGAAPKWKNLSWYFYAAFAVLLAVLVAGVLIVE